MSKPYAFVNDKIQNYNQMRETLFPLPVSARQKLDQLNPFLRNNVVMPGEIVVVSEGPAQICTPEETRLMQLAAQVRGAMIGMGRDDRHVMTRNFELLKDIMSYGSIGIGASTSAWSKHLSGLEELLKETEVLHQRWRAGRMSNDQFFAQRRVLFSRIETSLKGIGALDRASTIRAR